MADALRILVTGAGGFLGSHIAADARNKGHDVVASYRGATKSGAAQMDVCDPASLDATFRVVLPSVVIHCASYGVKYADRDPDRAFAVNTCGSLDLLVAAARYGVRRFVHIGSCFEYGHYDGPIPEEAPLNPTAVYGATKAAASLLLRERARTLGINMIVARPFGIWGPREPAFRLIPQVIAACIAGQPLKLTSCEVVRDYLYVEDTADLIVTLSQIPNIETGAIVNVGSGKRTVLREFVLSVARVLDGEALMRFGELPYRPTEMASLVADTHRLRNLLGERHQTSLAEGVRRMVASACSLQNVR